MATDALSNKTDFQDRGIHGEAPDRYQDRGQHRQSCAGGSTTVKHRQSPNPGALGPGRWIVSGGNPAEHRRGPDEIRPRKVAGVVTGLPAVAAARRDRGIGAGSVGGFTAPRFPDQHAGSFPRRKTRSRAVYRARDAGGISSHARKHVRIIRTPHHGSARSAGVDVRVAGSIAARSRRRSRWKATTGSGYCVRLRRRARCCSGWATGKS